MNNICKKRKIVKIPSSNNKLLEDVAVTYPLRLLDLVGMEQLGSQM